MGRELPRLALITDLAPGPERLLEIVAAAGRGGLRMLQARGLALPGPELARWVARCRALLPPGALILVNVTGLPVELAREAGGDGAHVGGGDPRRIAEARRALPAGAIVGYSAHRSEEIAAAEAAGADYASLSPILAPLSKTSLLPPLGFEALGAACRAAKIPVYALGGIDPAAAARARGAGAHGVAAIGAILGAGDPEAATRGLLSALADSSSRSLQEGR